MLATACVMLRGPAVVLMGQATGSRVQRESGWDAKIEALASRNPQPKLVKHLSVSEPFFAPDFDWDDQERVRIAFAKLVNDESPELWERLLKHLDDRRYALTLRDNGPSAMNYSVGDLCWMIAEQRLSFASAWHSDPDSLDRPDIYLDLGIRDLAKWRAERANKSLYKLQIEVCEKALEQVDRARDVPGRAKRYIRKEVRALIGSLRSTKRPLFFKLPTGGFEAFNAEMAKRVREKVEQKR
jgi:hypothetical protein